MTSRTHKDETKHIPVLINLARKLKAATRTSVAVKWDSANNKGVTLIYTRRRIVESKAFDSVLDAIHDIRSAL